MYMKKVLPLILGLAAASVFSGCASSIPMGAFYTDVQLPVAASESNLDLSKMKVGTATCKSYVGVVAIGDATVSTAQKNGGIKKIHAVDWKAKSILGLVGEYTTIVYGE